MTFWDLLERYESEMFTNVHLTRLVDGTFKLILVPCGNPDAKRQESFNAPGQVAAWFHEQLQGLRKRNPKF
jgi:hypothetical protein